MRYLQGRISDTAASEIMGLGSWRLKGAMDPPFEGLTAQIEGLWRHMLEDLRLYPMDRVKSPHTRLPMHVQCSLSSLCILF